MQTRSDLATFVCLKPEGVFTCAELVRNFKNEAVEAIAELEHRRGIVVEVDEVLAERKSAAGMEFLARLRRRIVRVRVSHGFLLFCVLLGIAGAMDGLFRRVQHMGAAV